MPSRPQGRLTTGAPHPRRCSLVSAAPASIRLACNWLASNSSPRAFMLSVSFIASMKEDTMSIAKITEITSESAEGFDQAIREGISRASKTLKNVRNVWIKDQEVLVKDDRPQAYRVTMKVTFVLND
jgi:dodecin